MTAGAREKVCNAIQETLGIHPCDIKDDDYLVDDYGADSLDCIEILIDLEDSFRIQIKDADFEKCKTVGDVVFLMKNLQ